MDFPVPDLPITYKCLSLSSSFFSPNFILSFLNTVSPIRFASCMGRLGGGSDFLEYTHDIFGVSIFERGKWKKVANSSVVKITDLSLSNNLF